jgi:hypothetical protein
LKDFAAAAPDVLPSDDRVLAPVRSNVSLCFLNFTY